MSKRIIPEFNNMSDAKVVSRLRMLRKDIYNHEAGRNKLSFKKISETRRLYKAGIRRILGV